MAADRRPPGARGGQHLGGGGPGSGRARLCWHRWKWLAAEHPTGLGVQSPAGRWQDREYIAAQIAERIPEIQRFTTKWITEHD